MRSGFFSNAHACYITSRPRRLTILTLYFVNPLELNLVPPHVDGEQQADSDQVRPAGGAAEAHEGQGDADHALSASR